MTRKTGFPAAARPDARLLILGSLPGDRSIADGQYYAHPRNQFWQLLSPIVNCDLLPLAYPDRIATLIAAGVALWDVFASADREGSGDAAIRDSRTNDLASLLDALPGLRAIAFNGGAAFRAGMTALGPRGRDYRILSLPSSSPLHTVALADKQPAWLSMREVLAGPSAHGSP